MQRGMTAVASKRAVLKHLRALIAAIEKPKVRVTEASVSVENEVEIDAIYAASVGHRWQLRGAKVSIEIKFERLPKIERERARAAQP